MVNKFLGVSIATGALAISAFALVGTESGLKVGEMVSAFHPKHVTGPHKGTDACPPCTFGNRPMVQVWVNGDELKNVAAIAKTLNAVQKEKSKSELKTFVIVLTDPAKVKETATLIEALAARTGANDVAMAYLPKNDGAIADYKVNIDSDVKNTVFIYRNRKVDTKIVNLKADEKGLAELTKSIEKITN